MLDLEPHPHSMLCRACTHGTDGHCAPSTQQRDRAAASQVSATTVSAEREIRSWGLYRNVPRLFTGPSPNPSAMVRVKGNILEGSSYP